MNVTPRASSGSFTTGASPRRKASTRAFAAAEGGKRTRLGGAGCFDGRFMGPIIIAISETAYLAVAQDSLDFALSRLPLNADTT